MLVLRLGDREEVIESENSLRQHLDAIRGMPFAEFSLIEREASLGGVERFIYRMLGLRPDIEGRGVHVLTSPDGAAVTFTDDKYGEYRALSPDGEVAEEDIAFRLSNGQRIDGVRSEVVSLEGAWRAVVYFYEKRARPPWWSYVHVP